MTVNDAGKNVNDGFFQLSFQNDGVFLSVYPQVGNGNGWRSMLFWRE